MRTLLLGITLPLGLAFGVELTPDLLERYGGQDEVFVGKLTAVQPGPVARSLPPIYSTRLQLTVESSLRGTLEAGQAVTLNHRARQRQPPEFPDVESRVVVGAKRVRGGLQVMGIELATDAAIAGARAALAVPLGWTVRGDGGLVSPWAELGKAAWAGEPGPQPRCAVTGRPALLGGGAGFEVAKVPPPKDIKWTNPDGDGAYTLTVTNPTDKPLAVPALLSKDGKILWAESVVIRCQDKNYRVPGSKGVPAGAGPTPLAPGQSVSEVVNALALQGPEWPRGGYRIEFQFGLGELSNTQSFYYMSKHHDGIRAALKAEQP